MRKTESRPGWLEFTGSKTFMEKSPGLIDEGSPPLIIIACYGNNSVVYLFNNNVVFMLR